MLQHQTVPVDIVLIHSSDRHVDDRISATKHHDGTAGLAAVLVAARAHNADIVLLAGDTFDNNRVPAPVLNRVGRLLADAGMPVVSCPATTIRRCPTACSNAADTLRSRAFRWWA